MKLLKLFVIIKLIYVLVKLSKQNHLSTKISASVIKIGKKMLYL